MEENSMMKEKTEVEPQSEFHRIHAKLCAKGEPQ